MEEEFPPLRAGDADRERAVDLLRAALTDGRLSQETFLLRLDAALQAETHQSLSRLTADLAPPPTPLTRLRRFVTGQGGGPSRSRVRTARCPVALPAPDAPTLVIGRRSQCDIVCDDETVSRVHASIAWLKGQWVVTDRGSTNGTWVNERRIWGTCTVQPGDSLRLARVTLLLTAPEEQRSAG